MKHVRVTFEPIPGMIYIRNVYLAALDDEVTVEGETVGDTVSDIMDQLPELVIFMDEDGEPVGIPAKLIRDIEEI